jgi:hypothetical protein
VRRISSVAHEFRWQRKRIVNRYLCMPFVIIFLISGTGCFIVWAFKALREARNGVRTTWTALETAIADRTTLATRLVEGVTPHISPDVAERLQRAHERMGHVVGPRGTDAADTTLRSILDPVMAEVPVHLGFEALKGELRNANQKIDDAAVEYNGKVDIYEAVRKSGGKQLFAEYMGFEKESHFGRISRPDLLRNQPALV